jgi:hypothetical protein
MLRRIVYASRAVSDMQPADLLQILQSARRNNRANGITGILVYANGDFLQALEGEASAIEQLYEVIEQDPRHEHCRILNKIEIQERLFENWDMGFQEIDRSDLAKREGFVDFFNADLTPKPLVNPTTSAQFLLLGFRSLKLTNAN